MSNRTARIVWGMLLAAMLTAFGVFMVPAHWNSIWMDTGFGGWVVPIANRLTSGPRLYEFGLHSPMPPLPFVLVHMLYPAGAVWITESLLNYSFQAATIIALFWAYSRRVGVAVAFTAACATIPVFFALPKAILYDSMAQFLVACVGIVAVACTDADGNVRPGNSIVRRFWSWGLLSFFLAALLLTKQSTGAGTALGVLCLGAVYPRSETPGRRLGNVLLTLGAAFAMVPAILLLMRRSVDFSQCIHDVFLTGSEPKGGPVRLAESAGWSIMEMAVAVCVTLLAGFLFSLGFGRRFPMLQIDRPVSRAATSSWPMTEPVNARPMRTCWAATGASVIGFVALFLYAQVHGSGAIIQSFRLESLASIALNVSLVLLLLRVGSISYHRTPDKKTPGIDDSEVRFALVFLCAALGHNLSAVVLRWSHDNNPVIFSALACLIGRAATLAGASPPHRTKLPAFLPSAAAIVIIMALWMPCWGMISMVMQCTEPWPEVKYLDGARLRPDAAGMRELVKTVRTLASGDSGEQVLLLPNDPGVEAWFERDRPGLSSAMIFVDQYWDRYVDDDFARLEKNPPKVIVIGPRGWWRNFGRHWQKKRGTERLIDLVQDDLITRRYKLYQVQEIDFRGGKDFMDIYARVDQ